MQVAEVEGRILEARGEVGTIPAEEVGESLLPVVGLVGIEGFVVESGHHLRHRLLGVGTRDYRRPSFLGRRLELGSKAFPLHVQVLVRPWNVDLPSGHVGTVLTNVGNVHGEAPAHGLVHVLANACLRHPGIRPIGLEGLLAVNDLNESPSAPVSRAPKSLQGIPRFDPPGGSGDVIGHLDPKAPRSGIKNENGQKPFDFLSETVLGLQNGPVGAFLQLEGKFLVALRIGREALGCDHFAQFPGTGIG